MSNQEKTWYFQVSLSKINMILGVSTDRDSTGKKKAYMKHVLV